MKLGIAEILSGVHAAMC